MEAAAAGKRRNEPEGSLALRAARRWKQEQVPTACSRLDPRCSLVVSRAAVELRTGGVEATARQTNDGLCRGKRCGQRERDLGGQRFWRNGGPGVDRTAASSHPRRLRPSHDVAAADPGHRRLLSPERRAPRTAEAVADGSSRLWEETSGKTSVSFGVCQANRRGAGKAFAAAAAHLGPLREALAERYRVPAEQAQRDASESRLERREIRSEKSHLFLTTCPRYAAWTFVAATSSRVSGLRAPCGQKFVLSEGRISQRRALAEQKTNRGAPTCAGNAQS